MNTQGLYVFCAIPRREPIEFGTERMAGQDRSVYTVNHKDVGMVVCEVDEEILPLRRHFLAHQRVVGRVFEKFTTIPFRFGTTVGSQDEVKQLAHNLYDQLNGLFQRLDNKIELGLRVVGRQDWLDLQIDRFPELSILANQLKVQGEQDALLYSRVRLGELAQELFESLEKQIQAEVHLPLSRLADESRLNDIGPDRLLLNAAYLIDRENEREFDNVVNQIYTKWEAKAEFGYSGPWPAYNFVSLSKGVKGES